MLTWPITGSFVLCGVLVDTPLFPAQETDAVGKQKAQERFQRLKTAYEVLKDPQTRKDYDSGRMAASG